MERWKRRMSSGSCSCCWRYKYLEIRSRESFKREKKRTFLWLPLYVTSEVDTSFVLLCWVGNFLLNVFVSQATPITKRNEIRKIVLSYSLRFQPRRDFLLSKQEGFLFHKSNERFQIVWSAEKQQNKENTCMYVCLDVYVIILHARWFNCVCVVVPSQLSCVYKPDGMPSARVQITRALYPLLPTTSLDLFDSSIAKKKISKRKRKKKRGWRE